MFLSRKAFDQHIRGSAFAIPIATRQSTMSWGLSSWAKVQGASFCEPSVPSKLYVYGTSVCVCRATYILKMSQQSVLLSTNKITPNSLCLAYFPEETAHTLLALPSLVMPALLLTSAIYPECSSAVLTCGTQNWGRFLDTIIIKIVGGTVENASCRQQCRTPGSVASLQPWGLMKCSWCTSREPCILYPAGVSPLACSWNSH